MLPHMAQGVPVSLRAGGGHVDRNPIAFKSIEERRNRNLGGVDRSAAMQFGDKASALDLRFLLGAPERMPALLARARCRVALVNDDGPVTGRALVLADFHFRLPIFSNASHASRRRFSHSRQSTTSPRSASIPL